MSTLQLKVVTNDVYCFRRYLLQKDGRNHPSAVLFALRHRFDLTLADANHEVLARDAVGPTLVRVHADRLPTSVLVQAPTFKGGWWPNEWKVQDHTASSTVAGELVLQRTGSTKDLFHASMGFLRCEAKPVFDKLPGASGDLSAIATLWPTVSNGEGLSYVLTPVGLAIEGALVPGAAGKDMLLLPRGLADAQRSDIAWPSPAAGPDDPVNTWFWNRLKPMDWEPPAMKGAGGKAMGDQGDRKTDNAPANNWRELVDALRPDAPASMVWPMHQDRWAILRWHVLTPVRQPVLDACFSFQGGTGGAYAAVRLQRLANALDLQDDTAPATGTRTFGASHGEVIAQYDVTTEGGGFGWKPVFNHRGGFCTAATPVAATLQWSEGGSSSVLTSRVARATWLPDGNTRLLRQQTVLRTVAPSVAPTLNAVQPEPLPQAPRRRRRCFLCRWFARWCPPTVKVAASTRPDPEPTPGPRPVATKPALDDLELAWDRGEYPGVNSLRLLPPSDMSFAGLSDPQGNTLSTANVRPGWMAVHDGYLQLAHSAYGDKLASTTAEQLLKATSDTAQVFRGGLPLELLGGPAGLTAWVVGNSAGERAVPATSGSPTPEVVLRLDDRRVQMTATGPVLVWRTPAWWAEPVAARPAMAGSDASFITAPGTVGRDYPPPNWTAPDSGDDNAFAPALSSLAGAFADCFSNRPEKGPDSKARLAKALEQVFMGTLWVGRVGDKDKGAWKLQVKMAKTTLSIPPARLPGITVWSGFVDAYLLRTLASSVAITDGPLLDPLRGLFPLRALADKAAPLSFDVTQGSLPAIVKPLFKKPWEAPVGWEALQAPGFHPNIGGLSFDPQTRQFTQCHAGQMRYDALLRALPDGTIGAEAAAVPLDWVQAADDLAIDRFAMNVPLENAPAGGWLPAPVKLSVTRTALELCGSQPHIQWKVAPTGASSREFMVNIDSHVNTFEPRAGIAAREEAGVIRVQLVDEAQGAPMTNLGQPLVALAGSQRLLDGAGRAWTFFDDGLRVSQDLEGRQEERRRTAARTAAIALAAASPLAPDTLTVSVLERMDNESGRPVWDVAGEVVDHAGSSPFIGPYELMHMQLVAYDDDQARLQARLAPPALRRGARRSSSAGGRIELAWSRAVQGWSLELLQGGSFEWALGEGLGSAESPTAPTTTTIVNVAGTARPHADGIQLLVSRLTLETTIGLLRIACTASAIEHVVGADGRVESLRLVVETEAALGMSAELVLLCQADDDGNRRWVLERGSKSTIEWRSTAQLQGLALDLLSGAVRFDHPLFSFGAATPGELRTAQSSDSEWMVQASNDGLEFAGLLQMITADEVASTQARLRYRALTWVADPRAVFGPCRTGDVDASAVRADVEACWQSALAGGTPVTGQSARLTGRLLLDNDFTLVCDSGSRYSGSVEVLFSEALAGIDANGSLVPRPTLDVMARHVWATQDGRQVLAFQVPQSLDVKRPPDGATTTELSSASLTLLRPSRLTLAEHHEVQLVCKGDPADTRFGVRAAPRTSAAMEGWLLRVPLRTSGQRRELKVPAGPQHKLSWFPVAANPHAGQPGSPGFWYERRALANVLDRETLDAQCRDRMKATFGGNPLPVAGDVLQDWTGLDAVAAMPTWMDSALLPGAGGAWATPYYAGVAVASRTATQQGAPADGTPQARAESGQLPGLQVSLLVPDATAVGGTKALAQALITDFGTARDDTPTDERIRRALATWARSEMRRRSCKTAALVAVHGQPALNSLVPRPYSAFAVLGASRPHLLPSGIKQPAYGAVLDFLDASEVPGHRRAAQHFVASTDAESVLELVDALPRVDRSEAAIEFRIATRSLLTDGGTLEMGAGGSGVMRQQTMRFKAQADARAPLALPALDAEEVREGVVTPVVLDAVLWAARAGETVSTRWSAARSAAMTGPGVQAQLRSPRPDQMENARDPDTSVPTPLVITTVASASTGQVDWSLCEIVSRTRLGSRYRESITPVMLTTLVTPRETLHFTHFTSTGTEEAYRPPGAMQLAVRVDTANNRNVLIEPIHCGTFFGAEWIRNFPIAPGELRAIGLVARRAMTESTKVIDVAAVTSVDSVIAGQVPSWNDANPPMAVILENIWQPITSADQDAELAKNSNYSPDVGLNLKELMRWTDFKPKALAGAGGALPNARVEKLKGALPNGNQYVVIIEGPSGEERSYHRTEADAITAQRRAASGTALHWLYEGADAETAACIALFISLPASPASVRFIPLYFLRWIETMPTDQPERVLAVRNKRVVGFSTPGGPVTIELAGNAESFECLRSAYALSPGNSGEAQAWHFGPSGACLATAHTDRL